MTCIVHDIPTKKALKERIAEHGTESVQITDPSIFRPFSGNLAQYLALNGSCVLTNHPKRSWFAEVQHTNDGNVKVK